MKWYIWLVAPMLIAGYVISGIAGLGLLIASIAITVFYVVSGIREYKRGEIGLCKNRKS